MNQLLVIAILTFGFTAVGADKKAANSLRPFEGAFEAMKVASPDYEGAKEFRKKNSRKPAGSDQINLDKVESGKFAEFRTELLNAMKNRDTFHSFLVKIDDPVYYAKPEIPNSVKYFAAQIALLRPMRSMIYRLRPVFEDNAPRVIHSSTVTGLRKVAENLNIFLPDERWKVAFDYVAAPTINSKDQLYSGKTYDTNSQFETVAAVQQYLWVFAKPRLEEAIKRITAMQGKNYGPDDYVWDNKILYPTARFSYQLPVKAEDKLDTNNPEQYHIHGPAEVNMVLSALHATAVRMAIFCAYRRDETFNVMGSLAKLQGFDGFAKNIPFIGNKDWEMGVTKQDRVEQIRGRKHFLTLYDEDQEKGLTGQYVYGKGASGKQMMDDAWDSFVHTIKLRKEAFDYVKAGGVPGKMTDNFATIINPVAMLANEQKTETELAVLLDLINDGFHAIPSTLTGETVQVNLKALFTNPPADLKAFLPVKGAFKPGENKYYLTDTSGKRIKDPKTKKEIWWRNYATGQATAWDSSAWSNYIKVPGGNMAEGLRILNQAWGGGMLAGTVAPAVN
jgi:hypothetical protein